MQGKCQSSVAATQISIRHLASWEISGHFAQICAWIWDKRQLVDLWNPLESFGNVCWSQTYRSRFAKQGQFLWVDETKRDAAHHCWDDRFSMSLSCDLLDRCSDWGHGWSTGSGWWKRACHKCAKCRQEDQEASHGMLQHVSKKSLLIKQLITNCASEWKLSCSRCRLPQKYSRPSIILYSSGSVLSWYVNA